MCFYFCHRRGGVERKKLSLLMRNIDVSNHCLISAKRDLCKNETYYFIESSAFTSGRRAQNASSEWNGQKSKVIVNLRQMHATVVVVETNVCTIKSCKL